MDFRLVPKLNDLEWRNGHYFAEFGSFRDQLSKSGWLAINRFPPENVIKYTKHDRCAVHFEIAEHLVGYGVSNGLTALFVTW